MRHRTRRRLLGIGTAALALSGAAVMVANEAFAASVTPGGMVSDNWSFTGAPAAGLTKLAFSLKVDSQPNYSSYYWAQQYYFQNNQVGYIGLQPRTNGGEAIFSVFGDGTSSTSSTCTPGADGGAGTSCHISYPYVTGRSYEIEVIHTGTNTWTGYVVDTSNDAWTTIGSWTVAAADGDLKPSGVGFQEYYTSVSSCTAIPYGKAEFAAPFTNSGQGSGRITSGSTYGKCAAQGGYSLAGGGITMTG